MNNLPMALFRRIAPRRTVWQNIRLFLSNIFSTDTQKPQQALPAPYPANGVFYQDNEGKWHPVASKAELHKLMGTGATLAQFNENGQENHRFKMRLESMIKSYKPPMRVISADFKI